MSSRKPDREYRARPGPGDSRAGGGPSPHIIVGWPSLVPANRDDRGVAVFAPSVKNTEFNTAPSPMRTATEQKPDCRSTSRTMGFSEQYAQARAYKGAENSGRTRSVRFCASTGPTAILRRGVSRPQRRGRTKSLATLCKAVGASHSSIRITKPASALGSSVTRKLMFCESSHGDTSPGSTLKNITGISPAWELAADRYTSPAGSVTS